MRDPFLFLFIEFLTLPPFCVPVALHLISAFRQLLSNSARADVEGMSVKDLKAFLAAKGVSTSGLLEKPDFVAKAKELCDS